MLRTFQSHPSGIFVAKYARLISAYLAFYGDSLSYSFTKEVVHDEQEWGQLESLVAQALKYLDKIPISSLNFDRAKAEFIRLHQQLE